MEFDFVIVNYHSTTDTASLLTDIESTFPHPYAAYVVDNTLTNRGFAAAANLGASMGTSEIIVFLNPDLHLADGWATSTIAALLDPTVAIAGPRLDDGKRWPRNLTGLGITGWVCGACFFVRRKVFESLGGFDERFFFTFEETDLIRRVEQAGYRVVSTDTDHPLVRHVRHVTPQHAIYFEAAKEQYEDKWG